MSEMGKNQSYCHPYAEISRMSRDIDEQGKRLAKDVANRLFQVLMEKPRASLAVSGGATPITFFQALSKFRLDWTRIDVLLVDERWVPVSDLSSNEALVKKYLLQNEARTAKFIPMKTKAETPEEGLSECEANMAKLSLPLDIVVLGMGLDGHTASLFPDMPNLAEALAEDAPRCIVARPENAECPRMSLSARMIYGASLVILHLGSLSKRKLLHKAFNLTDAKEDAMKMPIWGVAGKTDLEIYWCRTDEENVLYDKQMSHLDKGSPK